MSINRASGVFFVLLAAALIWVVIPAQTETVYPDGSIPPQALPVFYAALIGIFGAIVALRERDQVMIDAAQARKVGMFLVLTTVGVIAMEYFGFEYVAPVLAAVLLLIVGERRPLWLALGALIGPVSIWLFFEVLLGRLLP
ncbi:tripartite tricarboxylate transporter TctB family protein [Falsihalocynthiibacter sp. SS001]|uniref:tripartite tricarboxylate transporter TctB family protein n=1 Tax=Falsihalocynthiibacter sp. SS001 TaxID=3349698 RepID=UPI0036D2FF26